MVKKFLRDLGYDIPDSIMTESIETWSAWRRGKVDSFHSYKWYNGEKEISCVRQSLQLAKTVVETWSGMLFSDQCVISVDGQDISAEGEPLNPTAEFARQVFDNTNLWHRISEAQELKCTYGTVVYLPRALGIVYDQNMRIMAGRNLEVDIITADMLFPLTVEYGNIIELAVASKKMIKKETFVYVQLFIRDKSTGFYLVENHMIQVTDNNYVRIDINSIPGFENIPAVLNTESITRPFVVDRLNIANNIDPASPLGIAVFANAIDAMKTCDIIFDSMTTEYALGRTRLFLPTEALNNKDGKPYFDTQDVMFQFMPMLASLPDSVKKQIDVVQPLLRIDAHEKGLQLALNIFSSLCGLGESYYSFSTGTRTATEIMVSQSAAIKTKARHEKILEAVLHDLVVLLVDIGINILKYPGLNPEPEIRIVFEDGVVDDKISLKKQDILEVSQGLMKDWEFRVKWYGEAKEDAQAVLGTGQSAEDQDEYYANS